tara:strand:+ start:9023 stop:9328 length:306 start_codon:yes stop_codon:yes gene_type:complete
MKKIILLTALLLLTTSFKPEPKLNWLGTFEMYLDDEGSLVVYYKGNIPQCMGKKVIDFVYVDCDTVRYSKESIQKSLNIQTDIVPIDTCEDDKPATKITRI